MQKLERLQDCTSLTKLILDQCPVAKLPGLEKLHRLEKLSLKETKVQKLADLHKLDQLRFADLTKSQIDALPDLSRHSVTQVVISDTPVGSKLDGKSMIFWKGAGKGETGSAEFKRLNISGLAKMQSGAYYDAGGIYNTGSGYTLHSYYTYYQVYSDYNLDGWPTDGETFPAPPAFNSFEILKAWESRVRLPEQEFEPPYWLVGEQAELEKSFQRRSNESEPKESDGETLTDER